MKRKKKILYKLEWMEGSNYHSQLFFKPKEVDMVMKVVRHYKLTLIEVDTGETERATI